MISGSPHAGRVGQKVCVTGGAGFIGSHLVGALLALGVDVTVIDDLSSGSRENLNAVSGDSDRLRFIEGDIRNADCMDEAVSGCETVFHLAALGSVPVSVAHPERAESINAGGSLNVYAAARRHGVRRVVISSSCAVYGDDPVLPKTETLPPQPESPYATSKLAMEHYAVNAWRLYGQEVVILRYFNVFGPRQDPRSHYAAVIPIFISRLLENRPPEIFGDGDQTRDFVYVGDVVRANLLAAEAPAGVCGRPVNIARGEQLSVNRLYRELARLAGCDLPPVYRPERSGDIRHSVADVSQAKSLLGFEAATPLSEGLALTFDWYRNARKGER